MKPMNVILENEDFGRNQTTSHKNNKKVTKKLYIGILGKVQQKTKIEFLAHFFSFCIEKLIKNSLISAQNT